VQRVDEKAIREEAAPGREQRGRADAIGVHTEGDVTRGEAEREHQQAVEKQHPEDTFLGERADVRAVGRQIGDRLELARAEAERVSLGDLDAGSLGSEPLGVVVLERRAG
jgi:hypothetical protein